MVMFNMAPAGNQYRVNREPRQLLLLGGPWDLVSRARAPFRGSTRDL